MNKYIVWYKSYIFFAKKDYLYGVIIGKTGRIVYNQKMSILIEY